MGIRILWNCLLTGKDNDETLSAKMLRLSQKVKTLNQRVEDENLRKRTAIWKEPSNSLNDFPRLTEEKLDKSFYSYNYKCITCNCTCVKYISHNLSSLVVMNILEYFFSSLIETKYFPWQLTDSSRTKYNRTENS